MTCLYHISEPDDDLYDTYHTILYTYENARHCYTCAEGEKKLVLFFSLISVSSSNKTRMWVRLVSFEGVGRSVGVNVFVGGMEGVCTQEDDIIEQDMIGYHMIYMGDKMCLGVPQQYVEFGLFEF